MVVLFESAQVTYSDFRGCPTDLRRSVLHPGSLRAIRGAPYVYIYIYIYIYIRKRLDPEAHAHEDSTCRIQEAL